MQKHEFGVWQKLLKMGGYEKLSLATGFPVDQIQRWRRGEEEIPRYVGLTFMAVYHRLADAYPVEMR